MFTSPGSIAISTSFFTIYWYGIILGVAFLIGQFVIIQIAKREYKSENLTEIICELAFWALLGGILGARLYYVLLNLNYYAINPSEIIMLQNGGISIHGGLFGGIIAGYIYLKKNNLSFLKFADLYALGLPIAQAVGRWGNFFNSEAFGRPTDLPWGVFIPENSRPIGLRNYEYFHPTFLYESLWDIFIFLILFGVIKKYTFDKKGILFFSYLILYSIGRIVIESIRIDSVFNILGLPIAIWVSILIIIISLAILLKLLGFKSIALQRFVLYNRDGRVEMPCVYKNLEEIRRELPNYKGRIIAVTKYVDEKKVIEAFEAGLRDFGENKVQDALKKLENLPEELVKNSTWHFIGHLQSNKVRKVVGKFDYIHSVDTFELAKKISDVAKEFGIIQKILIEVNISGEKSKFGANIAEVEEIFNNLKNLDGIEVLGLMTMAPHTSNEVFLKKVFTNLKELGYNLKSKYIVELNELSMGMSSDYKIAVECGATMIRLGQRLFR